MAKGRVTFRTERCKACELCVRFCPQQILSLNKTMINPWDIILSLWFEKKPAMAAEYVP